MDHPGLTRKRIVLAFSLSVIADIIQFPITAVEGAGFFFIPGALADFVVDCVVMGAMIKLLGFHWMLLPSLILEAIPGLDLLPTWTACVAYVIWRRKQEQEQRRAPPPVLDIRAVEVVPAPPIARLADAPQAAIESTVEERLKNLNDLRDKNLISQTEYDTKRDQILAEI